MSFTFYFRKNFFLLIMAYVITFYAQAQAFYESSETNIGKAANATVKKPVGTAEDDLLVVGLMYEKGASVTISTPTGWTLIRRTDNNTDCGMATYYKVAGESEPENYSFGLTNGPKWSIGITRVTNANPSSPIAISGEQIGLTSSKDAIAPSITTTSNHNLILCFYTNKKAATYLPVAGTTKRYDMPNIDGGQPSNMMATFEQTTAGATGDKIAIASIDERWAAQQIAISTASILVAPLPVTIVSFTAIKKGIDAILNWNTAMELNNKGFEVQASTDGLSFTSIGFVPANSNNSTKGSSYTFADTRHGKVGTIYYRLKQVDLDGQFELFVTRAVEFENDGVSIAAYPNPFFSEIELSVGAATNEALLVIITDTKGKVVLKEHIIVTNGLNEKCLQIPPYLSSGLYMLSATWNNQTKNIKLYKK